MAVRNYEDILEEIKKSNAAQEDADIAAKTAEYDTNKKLTTDAYNQQINNTSNSYEDLYDENAVQKRINERQIAENMANLGLTDSGLNRTQQTAAQLSYANNKNKIDVTRQKAVDTLSANLAEAVAKLDTEKNTAVESIRSSYNNANQNYAQDVYNSELEAETERQKAYYSALIKQQEQDAKKSTIKLDSSIGSWKNSSNGNVVYTDVNGNSTTVTKYHNPYNNKYNADAETGTFSNGYQPNNISGYKLLDSKDKTFVTDVLGNEAQQTVWKYNSGGKTKYAVWSGADNYYYEVQRNGSGDWVVVGKAKA